MVDDTTREGLPARLAALSKPIPADDGSAVTYHYQQQARRVRHVEGAKVCTILIAILVEDCGGHAAGPDTWVKGPAHLDACAGDPQVWRWGPGCRVAYDPETASWDVYGQSYDTPLVEGVRWVEAALIVWALSHTPEYAPRQG